VRKAVADSLNARFGTAFNADNILMTVGAAGGLNVILKTLLNDGDEVLTFAPYFLEYGNYVANYGGILKTVMTDEKTFLPDPEKLVAAVTPLTKAVIVNTPNNPTGVVYGEEVLRGIASVLESKQKEFGTSIYIISDEPYRELCYDGVDVPWLTKYYRNTIVGYSWSKSLSLPGERIGYLCIPSEIDEYELIFSAAGIANRVLGFVNAPSLFQKVVAQCLDEQTDVSGYDRNRKLLYDGLSNLGFECVKPQGAFYLWVKTPVDEKEFVQAAKELRILLVPGSSFACPGYVRIAYCVATETIERSMPAFKELADKCGL
jgi:aspartate aminotransferase